MLALVFLVALVLFTLGAGMFLAAMNVWYRDIKLRTLSKDEPLDRTPVTPAAIPEAARKHELEILEQMRKLQPPKK